MTSKGLKKPSPSFRKQASTLRAEKCSDCALGREGGASPGARVVRGAGGPEHRSSSGAPPPQQQQLLLLLLLLLRGVRACGGCPV